MVHWLPWPLLPPLRTLPRPCHPWSPRSSPPFIQVHGIVHDTVSFVKKIISRELNAATDNPMVFAEDDAVISAGNFHGEYPAKVREWGLGAGGSDTTSPLPRRCNKSCPCASAGPFGLQAADFLAIGISELASISERRIERLVNHHLSGPRLKPDSSGKGVCVVPHAAAIPAHRAQPAPACQPASLPACWALQLMRRVPL